MLSKCTQTSARSLPLCRRNKHARKLHNRTRTHTAIQTRSQNARNTYTDEHFAAVAFRKLIAPRISTQCMCFTKLSFHFCLCYYTHAHWLHNVVSLVLDCAVLHSNGTLALESHISSVTNSINKAHLNDKIGVCLSSTNKTHTRSHYNRHRFYTRWFIDDGPHVCACECAYHVFSST